MLKKMFQDLKDMDEQRLAAIHGVIRQYVQEIQPPYDLIRERFITWRISISSIYLSNCFEHTQLHKLIFYLSRNLSKDLLWEELARYLNVLEFGIAKGTCISHMVSVQNHKAAKIQYR